MKNQYNLALDNTRVTKTNILYKSPGIQTVQARVTGVARIIENESSSALVLLLCNLCLIFTLPFDVEFDTINWIEIYFVRFNLKGASLVSM